MYKILSPEFLKKYKTSDYIKIGNSFYLKNGIRPRGGVKDVKMATLWGPNGQKQLAESGSPLASQLSGQGWGLQKGTYGTSALKDLGVSDSTINSLTDDQKALFISVGKAVQAQFNANKTVPNTFTSADLDRIMNEARNDPSIDAFYQEHLRVGAEQLRRGIDAIKGDAEATKAYTERQQKTEQRQVTEGEAAAGRAFSGFRQQAEEKLAADQQSVLESSRRELRSRLESAGGSFEQTFGSDAFNAQNLPSINGERYTPIGGIAGSEASAREVDVQNRYQSNLQDETLTRGLETGSTVSPESNPDTGVVVGGPAAVSRPSTTRSSSRQRYESQGWRYIGTMSDVQAKRRAGKTVRLLEGRYYYR